MKQRYWTIIKDVVFILLGILLISVGGFFGAIFGMLAIGWYGWQLYANIQLLRLEKQRTKKEEGAPVRTPSPEEGKITVTDLSRAKEVEYEKE